MTICSARREIDLSPFQTDSPMVAPYGLPQDVHFCMRCIIANQRPNSAVEYAHTKASLKKAIHFDDEGICDACKVADQKHNSIGCDAREAALRDKHRKQDCIVPGSGGKDSFYAAHMPKYKYGMHPLTVLAAILQTRWRCLGFAPPFHRSEHLMPARVIARLDIWISRGRI